MGGEVGTAPVKGQLAPSAAESRNAAVCILKIREPGDSGDSSLTRGGGFGRKVMQREDGARRIVSVRNPAGKIGPGPGAGGGESVWMYTPILLTQEPREDFLARGRVERRCGVRQFRERVD